MRRAEILIAICGILEESFFIMFYETESFDRTLAKKTETLGKSKITWH